MKASLLAVSLAVITLGSAQSAVIFNSFSTYAEDFDGFRGSEATLPAGFSATGGGTDIFRGVFDTTTDAASAFTGIMAATPDGTNHALAWRESTGGANLADGRIFLTITNNTGSPISGFHISYDVQAWVNGRRDNQVRFKYDTFLDSTAAGRSVFETDIFATVNPNHAVIAANGDQFVLDGSAVGNFVTVSDFVDLNTLLIDQNDPAAGVFGALADGETAYFRWQISNATLTDGNRSALGIDNLSITPVPEPGAAMLGALAMLAMLRRRR
jgi:MYXO-CTERM domain-containing protein